MDRTPADLHKIRLHVGFYANPVLARDLLRLNTIREVVTSLVLCEIVTICRNERNLVTLKEVL